MPQANSITSSPRCTSPRASESTLPCSSETIAARSSIRSWTSCRKANSTAVRRDSDEFPHSSYALAAASTALCTSAGSAYRTWACCAPVAGCHTGPVRTELPELGAPAIQCWMVCTVPLPFSQIRSLGPLGPFVVSACGPGAFQRGDLGDRYVPPRPAVRRTGQGVHLDVYDCGPVRLLRLVQRGVQFVHSGHPEHLGAEALRVRGQVHREHVPVQPAALGAVPVGGTETPGAKGLRQPADRGEAVVLYQHHDQLDPLLYRGHQLLRHHQVGAVADEHEHVPVRRGQLHPEATGDLVTHAGVAVLDVVALRIPGAPQLVQIAGHRAGRAHH